ncbi:hypothetical protein IAR50_006293 [Cryptococcus sp. DSM 104548]
MSDVLLQQRLHRLGTRDMTAADQCSNARTMLDLPNELLIMILHMLPVREIVSMRLVCQLFSQLAKSKLLYRNVWVDQFPWVRYDTEGKKVPHFYTEHILPHIRHLTVLPSEDKVNASSGFFLSHALNCKQGSPEFVQTFLNGIPMDQLETLVYPNSGFPVVGEIWFDLLAKQRNLRVVDLSGSRLDTDCMVMLGSMSNLAYLKLSGALAWDGWADWDLAFTRCRWPSIRYMDFSACLNINKEVFGLFLQNSPPYLQSLNLSGLNWVDGTMLDGVGSWGREDGRDSWYSGWPMYMRWLGLKGTGVSKSDIGRLSGMWTKAKLKVVDYLCWQLEEGSYQLHRQTLIDDFNLELLRVDHESTPFFDNVYRTYDVNGECVKIHAFLQEISKILSWKAIVSEECTRGVGNWQGEMLVNLCKQADEKIGELMEKGLVAQWNFERWYYERRLDDLGSKVLRVM